jgi:hypothetical protein
MDVITFFLFQIGVIFSLGLCYNVKKFRRWLTFCILGFLPLILCPFGSFLYGYDQKEQVHQKRLRSCDQVQKEYFPTLTTPSIFLFWVPGWYFFVNSATTAAPNVLKTIPVFFFRFIDIYRHFRRQNRCLFKFTSIQNRSGLAGAPLGQIR